MNNELRGVLVGFETLKMKCDVHKASKKDEGIKCLASFEAIRILLNSNMAQTSNRRFLATLLVILLILLQIEDDSDIEQDVEKREDISKITREPEIRGRISTPGCRFHEC